MTLLKYLIEGELEAVVKVFPTLPCPFGKGITVGECVKADCSCDNKAIWKELKL